MRAGLSLLPLLLWILYIRWKVGPADQGFGNFTWPVVGRRVADALGLPC